jgi:ABC-type molybdate transport system permease subunit
VTSIDPVVVVNGSIVGQTKTAGAVIFHATECKTAAAARAIWIL